MIPKLAAIVSAAEMFGLLNSTSRLTGQLFTLTSSMDDLEFNFGGQAVNCFIRFIRQCHNSSGISNRLDFKLAS